MTIGELTKLNDEDQTACSKLLCDQVAKSQKDTTYEAVVDATMKLLIQQALIVVKRADVGIPTINYNPEKCGQILKAFKQYSD